MPRKKEGRESLSVILTSKEYEDVENLAAKTKTSRSSIGRNFIIQGLNGTLTEDNMEFIAPIIREQVRNIMKPEIDRLAKMISKTCIQAGTAAYLSAETISRFLPPEQQIPFIEAYEMAQKKAIAYNSSKVNPEEIIKE